MHPWKLFMIPTNIKINRKGFPHKSASNSNAHCSMLYSISIHMGAHCLFYFCQERRRKEVTNFCCKNNNRRNLQESMLPARVIQQLLTNIFWSVSVNLTNEKRTQAYYRWSLDMAWHLKKRSYSIVAPANATLMLNQFLHIIACCKN